MSRSATAGRTVRLGEVLDVVSGQVNPRVEPYASLPHVGSDNIESATGLISALKSPTELGLISGKYVVEPGTVLYSKIRPGLNKVAIAAFRGTCSADIYPLKPRTEALEARYLAHLLRSSAFLRYADKHSARTNIPKINREALLARKIREA